MFPTCLTHAGLCGWAQVPWLAWALSFLSPALLPLLGSDASVTIDQLELVSSYLTRLETKV